MNNRQNNELVEWFRTIPFCTRYIFATTVVLAILGAFQVLSPSSMYYDLTSIISRFQIWRLVTCFFNYHLDLEFVFNLYFLYTYSSQLERSPTFLGRTGDYVYFIIVTMTFSLVLSTIFKDVFFFHSALIMSIIFLWSQYFKEVMVTFFFGIRFRALYLPYVLIIYSTLSRGGNLPFAEILGLISSYIYFYLHDIHPATGGANYLKTPQLISNYFGNAPAAADGIYVQHGTNRGQPQNQPGYNWGQGRRLGN
ncbi:hypothetical protein K7432_006489 [Basidiobolus ranarum]|uniref:Derlin n=1 Tax=Basidiobolus ranarum TaxID=34480 RepID=A0ABR2WUT6_9FUNG